MKLGAASVWFVGVIAGLGLASGGCGSPLGKIQPQDGGSAGGATGSAGSGSGSGGTLGSGGTGTGGGAVDAGDASAAGDGPPSCDGLCAISFISGPSWTAFDDDPGATPNARNLGPAQPVCLNASAPPNCPAGALLYGVAGVAWSQSLATIPGAVWIWGPGITVGDIADLQRFYFSRTFVLGAVMSGHITISADDAAAVRINGVAVDGIGSITDINLAAASGSTLTTFDISAQLRPGPNVITIAAQNGPPSYAGCASSCTYASNPAGVVFGGSITYR
jgi:hypothetical protein